MLVFLFMTGRRVAPYSREISLGRRWNSGYPLPPVKRSLQALRRFNFAVLRRNLLSSELESLYAVLSNPFELSEPFSFVRQPPIITDDILAVYPSANTESDAFAAVHFECQHIGCCRNHRITVHVARVLRIFPNQCIFLGNLNGSQIQNHIYDQISKYTDDSDTHQSHYQLKILTHSTSHSLLTG